MSFNLNNWLKETVDIDDFGTLNIYQKVRPRIVCQDGYSVSVQASEYCYCTPRYTQFHAKDGWHSINGNYWMVGNQKHIKTDEWVPYEAVELGYPSEEDELINDYAEGPYYTDTVYPYTPVEVVEKLIEKHGGFKCAEKGNCDAKA